MDLSISSEVRGEATVVHVGGEIDVYTAPLLREHLDEHISAGRTDLVGDLGSVTFMASTGLGVLVGRLKLVRAVNGTLRLVCSSERILSVFSITGLDKVFQIFPSVDDALSATASTACRRPRPSDASNEVPYAPLGQLLEPLAGYNVPHHTRPGGCSAASRWGLVGLHTSESIVRKHVFECDLPLVLTGGLNARPYSSHW